MDDKKILKYLLGLGLEELIRKTGGSLEDFIEGQNILPKEEQVPPQPKVDNQKDENKEWERRFGKG